MNFTAPALQLLVMCCPRDLAYHLGAASIPSSSPYLHIFLLFGLASQDGSTPCCSPACTPQGGPHDMAGSQPVYLFFVQDHYTCVIIIFVQLLPAQVACDLPLPLLVLLPPCAHTLFWMGQQSSMCLSHPEACIRIFCSHL